ncbi:PHD transcription factor-like protein [Cucurbitaria berberidis CBS 394.84]|uniref:PHD transcription factor-like protein n=1 Tax=Cucurbitaria berberidis CBS 394.84 TaxID=1168544 RepID=A0A9P4LB34_9PLEO|nr:PHD transcription factor-like protein [Cucurbitaria berberidis CBS 394.84]KAF1847972.1 PHD transcription factor-like protein [Cucurbitaria berberidis CBS 394.84]
MVDFIPPAGLPTGATMTTFRVAADAGISDGGLGAPKSKMGGVATPAVNGAPLTGVGMIPLSARKAQPLDLATVERRGHGAPNNQPPKPNRMFGLQEAPTYRPTAEQFKDPVQYIQSIREEAQKYGIVKVVPPDSWNPSFAIDTERFHFRTRRQELNSVEGGTRANLNYLDQLAKFHKQHGHSLTRFPSVDKRPLDLYKLKKAVETRGGFERVCKQKKWAEIGRDLGYSGKIMSSLSTSLKNSYQKWLHPYEEYLRVVKPGVQQMLEFEHGGPFTPSPAPSPMKKSVQGTPTANNSDSPAMRATVALNATLHGDSALPPPADLPRPAMPSGFTPVNSGGFTPVNAHPLQAPPAQPSTPASFAAVNAPNGIPREHVDSRTSTPLRNGGSPVLSAHNTPDLRPTQVGLTPLSNGLPFNQLKRTMSQDAESSINDDTDEANGRRSKRLKKDGAPTVAGSHMTQPRQSTPGRAGPRVRSADDRPGDRCETCGTDNDPSNILLCDSCDAGYHGYCLDPPIKGIPAYDWHCARCLVGTGEFGFEEGGVYSLKQFQERAHSFKQSHFANKMPFDPITNAPKPVTEDDVEHEFWHSVGNLTETVEVEYGADVHSTTHGSGFPTIERNPRDPYATDPWNLNILPYAPDSLFRHIKSDISGMTVPWLYVGMVFSTFCWHAEDHYTYSANYQHFGATKTWYGIPAEDVEKFEQAMREAVPELFESQPDLLFQLVTLLTPEQLKKAGVRVFALDQRAGEFVITFPQAYHAGFNHGFNFNEAVNFAPSDWEPFGEHGVQRLQDYRRQPCFSHDELLLAAASRKDTTIKIAKWLGPALERMRDRESIIRAEFLEKHRTAKEHACKIDGNGDIQDTQSPCEIEFIIDDTDVHEDELICTFCKSYSYLSRFYCRNTKKVLCLKHAGWYECCPESLEADRYSGSQGQHVLVYRLTDEALTTTVQKIVDKASMPEAWESKMETLLAEGPQPQLKSLRSLLNEGEKIDWELPGLPDLRDFVEKCQEVADDAVLYTTRKQQNRRKNERAWRGRPSKAALAEADEREREYRRVDNVQKLLKQAKDLGFDSPEITTLRERAESIAEFQERARSALRDRPAQQSIARLDELLEEGKGFNVDLPELESLEKVVQQLKWLREADDYKFKLATTLQEVSELIARGVEVGIPENHPEIQFLQSKKDQGEFWETKAKELMAVENVHYQQLDALSKQAATLPVTPETRAAVDAILKKQRDAQEQIMSLYERSKHLDFLQRPKYMEVRNAMEALNALNSKPAGTIDLEKEQKRHEDWMRRGKKLFGKANAPLHILHAHMKQVDERNRSCFDLSDQPRMPVEPASREQSPAEGEEVDGSGSSRDVFCICRKPEAGMMIECELCHEWYHGKCLKIARGKVKEDDKYTCPICDYRVKIPRDATRPKLEDLQLWQDEIAGLPFQPEEEETLESLIEQGLRFREYVAQYINPLMSSPDELTTQRFYLRKLEGAEILLSNEINFFRQELHKWAPVAPAPPPILQVSLSTRKPRPTKQQKLMNQLGITNPDDLPEHLKTKTHQFKRAPDPTKPQSLQPAPEQSHTPPGEPRRGFGENDYFNTAPTTTYNNSPTFATNAPLHFGGGPSIAPIDPGLFESSGLAPTSPMQDPFKSSGSGHEMFGEAMEMGGGQAEEALAVTESNSYMD